MSSPNGDSAGTPQRKSMRTRHKKSLGDDFIDPTAVSRVERFSTNKRKGISHSPAPSQELQGTSVPSGSSVSKLEGTVIKEEIEKESYSKEPEGPRRSNRQLRPSMKIKIVEEEALIAQMELKQEKSVSPIELKPEVKTDVFRPFPYDLTTDPYLIARCEPKITVHQKLRHPPNYVFEKRPRPINRLPSKQYNTTFADMESALDKGVITVDEERRLNEEADERVAAIRAASVQKILAKRSLGKVSTGSQKAAQNEEISRYVASTKNPVLVASPCEFPDEDVSQQIFERPAPRQIQSHQMTEEEQRIFAYAKKIAAQEAAQPITSPPLQPEQALKINSDRNDDTNVKPRSVAETETMRQGYELVRLEDQKPRQLLVRTRNPFPGLQYEPLPEPPKKKKKSEETNNLPPLLQQRLPGPGGFRTVTVMPHSMHYDADGNPAGPSTESTATQRTIKYKIVTNTTGGQSRPQVHRIPTAVVAKGPDGKPLPPRRLVVMNPAAFKQKIQQPKIDQSPTTEVERDKYSVSPSSPGQSNNSNIVSVKFIKDKNAYKTAFATGAKNLHPHQPQVVLEEERMVEVKQEVVEVKGEPPEEFDGAPILQQEIISEEPRTNQLPLDPNFAVRRVLIFRQKETPLETIDVEPLEDLNECERSPSPDRFYLGAEEPMKDFDEDQYRYNRYSVKVVKEFSAKLLRPFGKRPPGMAHKKLEPGAPGMSSVLVADLDVQKYEIELAKEKEEEKKVKEEKDKFFTRESLRQQQARAARLNVNEMRIWQYMQTERFRELYKPHGKLGPFEEMTMDSDGMASFHESLSKRNPELFNDLLRIVTIKKQDKCNQAQLYPVRSYNRLHTPRASGPIRLERSLAEDRSKKPVPPQGPPNLVKVIWKGVTGKVPEWIPCHLCRELMRLCMRKSNYRGELREYPAYRCLRKGCQTFRSIKKIMSNPKTTTETKVAKGGEKDATIRFKRRPSSAMPQRETEWTVREYLKSERSERVRKNKFDEMSKDYICSSSIEEAVRQDMEEDASADEDDEEDDELVEWSAYPGSAASNEELNEDGAHGGEWDDDDLGDDYNQFAPDDQYDHVELDYLSDSDALKARRRQIANYFLIKDPNSLNELDELTDEQISELLPDESMLERYTDKEIKIEVMEDEIVEKKPELL